MLDRQGEPCELAPTVAGRAARDERRGSPADRLAVRPHIGFHRRELLPDLGQRGSVVIPQLAL